MPPKPSNSLLSRLEQSRRSGRTEIALLLDPDKTPPHRLRPLLRTSTLAGIDYILVGSSLLQTERMDEYLLTIRELAEQPIIQFPGHSFHLSKYADGILFLSLISGRNPELLIGQQVQAAFQVWQSGIEVIPTGYMLIDGGRPTSVSYMSQTIPIPREKKDIALNTALAGQLLGLQTVYLEAGSGARQPVPDKMVLHLRRHLDIPVIVGGGIRSPEQAATLARAGADLLVVGTAGEKDPGSLQGLVHAVRSASLTR